MHRLALLLMLAAPVALAKPTKKATPKATPAPTTTPAASKPAEVAPSAASPASTPTAELKLDANATPASLVTQLNGLYESLEYERVIPFAEACLKRNDLQVAQQLEVYRLLGSAKAIVEDPVDAEKPFRLLLRARPDYDLPGNTPPKILAVFRKVQTEEKALAGKLREVERDRIVTSLKLLDELPAKSKGGEPLQFSLRLRDPGSAVESVKVSYRKSGEKAYSALALQRAEQGDWRGAIPGDFTATSGGFPLEFFVETADATGPLLKVGADLTPRTVTILPGLVQTRAFKPVAPALLAATMAITVAVGIASAVLGVAFNLEQSAYRTRTSGTGSVSGAELTQLSKSGASLAVGVNISLIALGVTTLASGIMLPLTDFDPTPR